MEKPAARSPTDARPSGSRWRHRSGRVDVYVSGLSNSDERRRPVHTGCCGQDRQARDRGDRCATDGTLTMNMTSRLLLVVALLMLSAPSPARSQNAVSGDRWAAARFLVGSWEGTSEGQPGKGTVRREYRLVLRDQF